MYFQISKVGFFKKGSLKCDQSACVDLIDELHMPTLLLLGIKVKACCIPLCRRVRIGLQGIY